MNIKEISVNILTKNSEKYLEECLESLKNFGEIIILDNGSDDKTFEICSKYSNVKIHKHDFIGFGPLKNMAVDLSENDWILSMDSDEIMSKSLFEHLKSLNVSEKDVYAFKRDNFYKDKHIKCCGWTPDYVIRLFNRKKTRFNNNLVHESVMTENVNLKYIKKSISHYSYSSIEELIEKMQKYSSIYAKENAGKKKTTPYKAVSRALFCFIKNYFFRKGIFSGYYGLLISICMANGVFYKYMKLYEENKLKNR